MSGVRYDSKTVAEVQRLADAGWSQRRIRGIMLSERGHSPSFETISRWLNPRYAERSRARVRRVEGLKRAESWTFRLPGPGGRQTSAYREAFIRRLDEADVPKQSIAKVCTILFGEPVSRERVRRLLVKDSV